MAKFRYQHIKSSVEGKAPTAAQIKTAEIGVNDFAGDEKLFIKNSEGEVVDFPRGYSQAFIDENERVTAEALNYLNTNKLDASAYTPTDLSDYYTKDETSGKTEIQDALDEKADTATTYTKDEVDARDLWVSGTGTSSVALKGGNNTASGSYSVTMGSGTTASGNYSVAEGNGTTASSDYSHAEGEYTTASGNSSHAEGTSTKANGYASHAEGYNTTATSQSSHAEGYSTIAIGEASHAEGGSTKAVGNRSHAEGLSTTANGDYSHAEGADTTASGVYSHAEGSHTIASGISSHAEGSYTTASGDSSHAEGSHTIASGISSHAEGYYTIALNVSEHASGRYNVSSSGSSTFGDSGNTLFSVGNGTYDARHNAFEIRQNGDIYIVSGNSDIKLQDYIGGGGGSITVDQVLDNTTSASTNPVSSKAVYDAVTDNELVWTNAFVTLSGVTSAHTADTSIHITSADRTKLDSITGNVGTMAYQNTNAYSSATEVNTALGGKANTATTLDGYGITDAYTKTEVDARDLWVSGTGTSSVAQKGGNNTASGNYSVAMGSGTTASGNYSVAEGNGTKASGQYSHAEGNGTTASGSYSHAEGNYTTASGTSSHAEGVNTIASGPLSHAEGYGTSATTNYSHAEGYSTTASGTSSHAEGYYTIASSDYSHAEGEYTTASGNSSHAEGTSTKANGYASHAEGYNTTATSQSSHAEGYSTIAIGEASHAEGGSTKAIGNRSHAEGELTTANGKSSHAEGYNTTASGESSHAEGYSTIASGYASHAEGQITKAVGNRSHAEGYSTIASSDYSHAEGYETITLNESEHASGRYNVPSKASSTFGDSGNTLFSVGNGTAYNARHNAFEIRQNGDIYITSGGTNTSSSIKLQDYIGSVETVTAITPSNSGSTEPIATKVVAENELTVSNALNDLESRKLDASAYTTTSAVTSGSTDVIESGGVYAQLDGIKLKKITQSDYDQLQTKDPNTLYFITD